MLKVLTNSNAMLHIFFNHIQYTGSASHLYFVVQKSICTLYVLYKGEMNYYSKVKKDSRLHK